MRECMIDGPRDFSQGVEVFFKARAAFIYEQFGRELSYKEYVVSQFEKMHEIPDEGVICFWFEDDLFCQANFWFLMYYLKYHKAQKFLVRSGDSSPYSFAGLSDKGILEAFKQKKELEAEDLSTLWKLYEADDKNGVEALSEVFFEEHPFIKAAFEAHFDRLASGQSFGKPKETLKEIGTELGFEDFGKVFREFQRRVPIYGYGDLQVQNMLKELKKEK